MATTAATNGNKNNKSLLRTTKAHLEPNHNTCVWNLNVGVVTEIKPTKIKWSSQIGGIITSQLQSVTEHFCDNNEIEEVT